MVHGLGSFDVSDDAMRMTISGQQFRGLLFDVRYDSSSNEGIHQGRGIDSRTAGIKGLAMEGP